MIMPPLLNSIKRLIFILTGTALGLLIGEAALYLMKYPQNSFEPQYLPHSKVPDKELGWVHNPGIYRYKEAESGRSFQVTFLEDGSRTSGQSGDFTAPTVLLLGCSFVEGFGLDDKDTFAWKLQELLPQIKVLNFGTSGYGTLQSLLLAKRFFSKNQVTPALVIYGFADFHSGRNVKNTRIQRWWNKPGIFPFCDRSSCGTWPGKMMHGLFRQSRLFSLFENTYDELAVPGRVTRDEITLKLLKDLKAEAGRINSSFYLTPISPIHGWDEKLQTARLPVINCLTDEMERDEFKLSDGHPNENWSALFADCLAKQIPGLLKL